MANKTLLDAVNEILRKKGLIAGDASLLGSLTDSARQASIDLAIQVVNEGIDEVYSTASISLPNQMASSTLTLITNTRDYVLPTDLVRLRYPLIDRSNTQFIMEYANGYEGILLVDPQQIFTGLPHFGAIRQTDGHLFVDRIPTVNENGRVYNFVYDKDTVLTAAADTVPFNNAVFRAMVPAWAQMWEREKRTQAFDAPTFKASIGRAARLLTQKPAREGYNPRMGVGIYPESTDPIPG